MSILKMKSDRPLKLLFRRGGASSYAAIAA